MDLEFFVSDDKNDVLAVDSEYRIALHYKGATNETTISLVMPEQNIRAKYAGIANKVMESDLPHDARTVIQRAHRWAIEWIEEVGNA